MTLKFFEPTGQQRSEFQADWSRRKPTRPKQFSVSRPRCKNIQRSPRNYNPGPILPTKNARCDSPFRSNQYESDDCPGDIYYEEYNYIYDDYEYDDYEDVPDENPYALKMWTDGSFFSRKTLHSWRRSLYKT